MHRPWKKNYYQKLTTDSFGKQILILLIPPKFYSSNLKVKVLFLIKTSTPRNQITQFGGERCRIVWEIIWYVQLGQDQAEAAAVD